MAAYHITVGEAGAPWQALASPEERNRELHGGSIWEGGPPLPSPPLPWPGAQMCAAGRAPAG